MATYKLIQDVEAEDHILGPLTLRQFIFALIAVLCFYLSFFMYVKHLSFFILVFFPPGLFFGFFAIPFGRDQPTEVWALAKIRYYIKPRKRFWNQSGIKELVTITAPKKVERILTNGLNQYEVKSRLKALANTLDSRGWAFKTDPVNTDSPAVVSVFDNDDQRLINMNSLPQVQIEDNTETDILDEQNSPISRQFDQLIDNTSIERKRNLIQEMQSVKKLPDSTIGNDQWFMPHINKDNKATAPEVNVQEESASEKELSLSIKKHKDTQQNYISNLRTIRPLNDKQIANVVDEVIIAKNGSASTTTPTDPAIISLANNDDLSVATIAREANKTKGILSTSNEVVISLH